MNLRKELNSITSTTTEQEQQIKNSIYELKSNHSDEMVKTRNECRVLVTTAAVIKNTKNQLIDNIRELGPQIVLWEKKIQLKREMKDAINSLLGQEVNRQFNTVYALV